MLRTYIPKRLLSRMVVFRIVGEPETTIFALVPPPYSTTAWSSTLSSSAPLLNSIPLQKPRVLAIWWLVNRTGANGVPLATRCPLLTKRALFCSNRTSTPASMASVPPTPTLRSAETT